LRTLIAYATNHGCAARAAARLALKLGGEVVQVDLRDNDKPDLARFEAVVVGGSIHAGHVQKAVKRFCAANAEALLARRLGLFLCCMYEGDTAQRQLEVAYPSVLRAHASATGLFGGAFDFEKMSLIERTIVKKVAGVCESISKLDPDAIDRFAADLAAQKKGDE
jgi:menaquinone-dependent protoporphyrinogen oxidase